MSMSFLDVFFRGELNFRRVVSVGKKQSKTHGHPKSYLTQAARLHQHDSTTAFFVGGGANLYLSLSTDDEMTPANLPRGSKLSK